MDELQEQTNSRPWLYKKGQSGNPAGRPKGSKTLKTYLAEKFKAMTDEEREEFFDGMDKKVLFEMAEGKPKQDVGFKGSLTIGQVLDKLDGHETEEQELED